MILLGVLCVMLVTTACSTTTSNDEELRIGLLVTLSGPAAVHGQHVLMGSEKAVVGLNSKGSNIVLLVEDNQNNPSVAVTAYQKIKAANPDIIFTTMSGASKAIIPLAERDGIPVVTSLTYADFQSYGNVYQYFQTTEDLAQLAADFFTENDVKRIGLLSSNIEAGHALMDVAASLFISKGIEIVGTEYYPPGDADHRAQILKLVESQPDAIYVFDLRPDQIVTQIKNQYEGMIVFTDTPVATNLYKLPEMDGVYTAAQEYMITGTAENAKFMKLFEGGNPNAEAGMGYDVIQLVAGTFDSETWPRSVVTAGTFNGLAGKIDLGESRKPSIPIKMAKIQAGTLVIQ